MTSLTFPRIRAFDSLLALHVSTACPLLVLFYTHEVCVSSSLDLLLARVQVDKDTGRQTQELTQEMQDKQAMTAVVDTVAIESSSRS